MKESDPRRQSLLIKALGFPPLVAHLLINRKITNIQEAKEYLFPEIAALYDPYLLKDMDRAIQRIKLAQGQNELVLIFGDYDVDGVTSSVLLSHILKNLGIRVVHFIPHRMHNGYGFTDAIASFVKEKGVKVIITVDCGMTAFQTIERFQQQGIDIIVFDHHEPKGNRIPAAHAVVNPKRPDCSYPFKHLASVGIVAKFAQALLGILPEEHLDIITLGTIADVAPLIGENRILVKTGLPKIGETRKMGLQALLEVAKIKKNQKMRPYHVGYILGPRINATGRMDSAHVALDLLLAHDREEAFRLAGLLDKHNQDRQKIQKGILEEAMQIIEQEVNFKNQRIIVVSKDGWHKGVLGIVAARMAERYYRPSIVISLDEAGIGTASARSIDGFHICDALSFCQEILENFGGHEGAAGLTIRRENIEKFKDLINTFSLQNLSVDHLIPCLEIDAEVALSELSLDLAQTIEEMEPFGEGNPHPLFCTRRLKVKTPVNILGKETIKFWVTDGRVTLSAVGFGMAKYRELVQTGGLIDLAYQVSIDDWNKAPAVQLQLKDIRISS